LSYQSVGLKVIDTSFPTSAKPRKLRLNPCGTGINGRRVGVGVGVAVGLIVAVGVGVAAGLIVTVGVGVAAALAAAAVRALSSTPLLYALQSSIFFFQLAAKKISPLVIASI
jgi:hypothetical protein